MDAAQHDASPLLDKIAVDLIRTQKSDPAFPFRTFGRNGLVLSIELVSLDLEALPGFETART